MAVTKRDFETIAAVIKTERETAKEFQNGSAVIMNTSIALGLAAKFAEANPRFDRETFLVACGIRRS